MGDLGVEYGFYGSEWDSSDPMTFEEVRLWSLLGVEFVEYFSITCLCLMFSNLFRRFDTRASRWIRIHDGEWCHAAEDGRLPDCDEEIAFRRF